MPWYYEGPDSKPVGPISLEELHARRLNGTISPETYIIEQTGQPGESLTWKFYREIFPALSNPSPVLPPAPPVPVPQPPAARHPLFPSAAPIPGISTSASIPQSPFPSTAPVSNVPPTAPPSSTTTSPHYYPVKKTNVWCAWGFALGIISFFLSLFCGIGLFTAIPALFICIVGLMQVHKQREEGGQRRAVAGLVLTALALIISLIWIVAISVKFAHEHGQTTTEQTSNSSD